MHDRAGTAALPSDLIDIDELIRAYHDLHPDVEDPEQRWRSARAATAASR